MPVWPRLPAALSAAVAPIAFAFALNCPPAAATPPSAQQSNQQEEDLCREAVTAAENLTGIPQHLMRAISLVESGIFRPEAGGRIAWPWTVMAEGRGRYFTSQKAAIDAVRGLLQKGITNIDVGCMQVNLRYHGLAFSSLEEAFDPITNVAYAASFLVDLKSRHGNWDKAVRYYHSATPSRNKPYRTKVRAELVALRKSGAPMSAAEHTRFASQFAPDMDGQDSKPVGKAPYGGVMNTGAAGGPGPLLTKTGQSPLASVPNGPPRIEEEADQRMGYLKTAQWPPRSLKAQYQVENNARARVMFPSTGTTGLKDKTLFNPFLNQTPVQTASNPPPS